MATSCGYEFQLQHLRLESADESQFYEFQWWKKKLPFVLYRAFLFGYHWGWMIAAWVLAEPDNWYTLSNWSFFVTGLYFLLAFVTALYGIIARKDYTSSSTSNSSDETEDDSGYLRFFHKATWVLHVNATITVVYVTVLYWALLAGDQTEEKRRLPIGQHKHSVQGGLILIDFFLIGIPTRWVHLVYNMAFGLAYSVFTVIVHLAEVESAIYGFLDYKENVGLSIGVLAISTFVVPSVLHTIWFALYHLRALIFRQTVGKRSEKDNKAKFNAAHDNVAFSA